MLPPDCYCGMVAVSSTCMPARHAGTLAHKPLVSEHPDTVPQQCRVIPEHVSHDSKPHETLDPELNNSPLTAFPRSLATYTHVGRSTFSSTEILYTCYNDHIHVTPFLGARGKPRREACESGQGPTGGQGGGVVWLWDSVVCQTSLYGVTAESDFVAAFVFCSHHQRQRLHGRLWAGWPIFAPQRWPPPSHQWSPPPAVLNGGAKAST